VGHKIHPYGFRLGVIYPWKSNWYAGREYAQFLHEDIWIRKHVRSRLTRAGISSIDIERKGDQIWVFIRTARPGIVIGRKGAEVDRLRKDIERFTKKRVDVKVEDMNQASSEVRPETDAALLAQNVAEQLQGRVAFRRAMRRAVQTAMRSGALGVRVADPTRGFHSPTQTRKGVAADNTFYDGVADILFNRRPFTDYDQLVNDWRTNAGDAVRKEYADEINASLK